MVEFMAQKRQMGRQPDGSGIRSLGRIGGFPDGSVNKGRHFRFPLRQPGIR